MSHRVKLSSRKYKNNYMFLIKDEFGYEKRNFYCCTEKKIKQILFHEYILLKLKCAKNDKTVFYPYSKLQRKGIKRIRSFNFFSTKKEPIKTFKINDTYQIKLNVGYNLMHTLTYKQIDKNTEYEVIENNMYEIVHHGYFDRQGAISKASSVVRNHPLFSKNSSDDGESDTYRQFGGNKVIYSFDYWYQSSYEYDEWDESAVAVKVQKIKYSCKL